MIFSGSKNLERRGKGLIRVGDWRALRVRPVVSLSDRSFAGNQYFRSRKSARLIRCRADPCLATSLKRLRLPSGPLIRAVSRAVP